jgi:predicted  nucleic acid-binding Zn-ribbon protein
VTSFARQGMVSRSELAAAQSEAKASKADAEAKGLDLLSLKEQLSKKQEQLLAVRAETAQLQRDIGSTVSKAELNASHAESDKLRGAIAELQGMLRSLEDERSGLLEKMQVSQSAAISFRSFFLSN